MNTPKKNYKKKSGVLCTHCALNYKRRTNGSVAKARPVQFLGLLFVGVFFGLIAAELAVCCCIANPAMFFLCCFS
jgi:hypothetical protein